MLHDTIIRNLKTREKLYKKTDSAGLYMYVTLKGKKILHIDVTFRSKHILLYVKVR